MKKVIWNISAIILLAALLFGIYKFFFDCHRYISHFDREFTLEVNDYAKIADEAYVKLLSIKKNECQEKAGCEREGQTVAKLLVVNHHRITYVSLGTLADKEKELTKLKYKIRLVKIKEGKATLKLSEE